MQPIHTEDTNDILRAPAGAENVADLPITRGVTTSGIPFVDSVWEMDEAERAEVAKSGRIYFTALGCTHPPVALSVYRPDYQPVEGGG